VQQCSAVNESSEGKEFLAVVQKLFAGMKVIVILAARYV
jgi:hypothetical protein